MADTPHDTDLIEHMMAMTPSSCDEHGEFAVFNEGGSPPPCPWCEINRLHGLLRGLEAERP